MTAATPALDRWTAAAARVRPTPPDVPDVPMDRTGVMRALRCDEATLEQLVAQSILEPAADGTFGACAVMNLGLYSRSRRTVPELAESLIVRFAGEPAGTWGEPRAWRIEVEAACPLGDACDGGEWDLPSVCPQLHPDARVQERREGGSVRLEVAIAAGGTGAGEIAEPEAGRLYRECLDHFASGRWQYQYVPPALREDPRRAASLGTMDCFVLAAWLHEAAREAGLDSRVRTGALLTFMGTEHAWVEVRDRDGEHKPIDPILPVLASRSGEPRPEFERFLCGSRINRLLAWDAGGPAGFVHRCGGAHRQLVPLIAARTA